MFVKSILILAVFLYLFFSLLVQDIGSFDESYLIVAAKTINQGIAYYRDVICIVPPLSLYLCAFFIKPFNSPIFASRILELFILLASLILLYKTIKHLKVSESFTYFILLLFAYRLQSLRHWYSYNTLCVMFSLISLLCFLKFLNKRSYKHIFLAGLFLGLMALTKQTIALACTAAIALCLVFDRAGKKEISLQRVLSVLAFGISAPILVVVFYYFKNGLLQQFASGYFLAISTKYFENGISYFSKHAGFSDGGWLRFYMLPLIVILIYVFFSLYLYFSKKKTYPVLGYVVIFSAANFFAFIYPIADIFHFAHAFYFVILIIACAYNIFTAEQPSLNIGKFKFTAEDLALIFVILLSAATYVIPDYLSFVVLFVFFAEKMAGDNIFVPLSRYIKLKYAFLVLCLFLFSSMLSSTIGNACLMHKRVYYQNIFISKQQFRLISEIKKELGDSKQYVLQAPSFPLLYLIGNYINPTRFYIIHPNAVMPQHQQEIIDDLKTKNVRTVVLDIPLYATDATGFNSLFPDIADFIKREYSECKVIDNKIHIYKK
ncbi:MAG: glycosyltransferase family 39 protein [Candidatus Omnitrophota bacterium]